MVQAWNGVEWNWSGSGVEWNVRVDPRNAITARCCPVQRGRLGRGGREEGAQHRVALFCVVVWSTALYFAFGPFTSPPPAPFWFPLPPLFHHRPLFVARSLHKGRAEVTGRRHSHSRLARTPTSGRARTPTSPECFPLPAAPPLPADRRRRRRRGAKEKGGEQ